MEIGLSGFIKFVNASQRVRPRIARVIAEQSQGEYSPGTDFWRPMRNAIRHDRKTTRDGESIRAAVRAAPSLRQGNYREVSEHWFDLAGRWQQSAPMSATTVRLEVGGLTVRLAPLFTEIMGDGRAEAAHVWFNKEDLKPETVEAVQQLMARLDVEVVEPTFVDLRRDAIVPVATEPGADDWLDDIGRQFRRLIEE